MTSDELKKHMRELAKKPRSPHKKYCIKFQKQDIADVLGLHRTSLTKLCKRENINLSDLSLLDLINFIITHKKGDLNATH